MAQGTLVLVRHGESRMNLLNRFTGWIDIPLSEKGIEEAHRVAGHCAQFSYDAAFTSNLERARETLLIILSKQERIGLIQHPENKRYREMSGITDEEEKMYIPIFTGPALNERSYGRLQGMEKSFAREKFGEEAVLKWRRGYEDKPPGGESLKEVHERAIPYFEEHIRPRCERGETVIVAGHGNTLRAFIKHLERIDDERISHIDLPTAHPLVYRCNEEAFVRSEGEYRFDRPLR